MCVRVVPVCVTHSRKGLRSSIDRPAASAGQADGRSLEASPYLMEALAPLFWHVVQRSLRLIC